MITPQTQRDSDPGIRPVGLADELLESVPVFTKETSVRDGTLSPYDETANMMSASSDDELLFADDEIFRIEDETADTPNQGKPWRVLVVDDDEDVLRVTRLGYRDLAILDRPVHLEFASSAEEAKEIFSASSDIAVVITDVVMETTQAGLELVEWLRSSEAGRQTRIVVRTGQPGYAPEESVLTSYEINDYWPKTFSDIRRMRSQLLGLIRSYRDIVTLDWQTSQLTGLMSSLDSLIGVRKVDEVFQHFKRDIEPMAVSWAAFLCSRSKDGTVELTTLGSSKGLSAGELSAMQLATSNQIAGAPQPESMPERAFIVKSVASDDGMHVAVAFRSDREDDELRQILDLRGSIYAQAFRSATRYEGINQLLEAASRFVPAKLINWLGHRSITDVRAGDHKTLTAWVLFVDIRGFTGQVESMPSGKVQELLQNLFGTIIPCIEEHGGAVDKLLGDGLMAIFVNETAPLDCCDAIVDRVKSISPSTSLSLGLHGGLVNLCALGYSQRIEVTAISDVVNIAARLEQANRHYGTTILTTQYALDSVPAHVSQHARALGKLHVRGRRGLVDVVQLMVAQDHESDLAPAHEINAALDLLPSDRLDVLSQLADNYPTDQPLRALLAEHRSA